MVGFPLAVELMTVRLFLATALGKSWLFYQLDINNGFLGHLDEEIYIIPPRGYFKAKNR